MSLLQRHVERFGNPLKPGDWFLLPLHVIDKAGKHIQDPGMTACVYAPPQAMLVRRN